MGCGGHIEAVLVGGSWPVVVKCGDDPFVGFFFFLDVLFYCSRNIILL